MPCTQCMAPYTAFRNEEGCSNCAFGFCSKCLAQKAVVPQLSSKPVSVCLPCYRKLTQPTAKIEYSALKGGTNERWWPEGELPPPSMRHNHPTPHIGQPPYSTVKDKGPQRPARRNSPRAIPPPYSKTNASSDEAIQQRLDKLKTDRAGLETQGACNTATLSEIEERLAKLREVSVEEIRNPSIMFARKGGEVRGETVKELMEKARDEAILENKWDPVKQLERRYNQYYNVEQDDPVKEHQLPPVLINNPTGYPPSTSGTNDDIMMGEDTIRGIKDLERTLKIAKQDSIHAAESAQASNKLVKREMEQLAKLTRQESLNTEKITSELGSFWERNLDKYANEEEDDAVDGVSEEELNKIIHEAEQAENEVKKEVKESQRTSKKEGFFSRLFHRSSRD